MFRKKRPEPAISRAEALDMVPVRNETVEERELPGGLVLLAYPLAVKPWFGRLADKVGLWDGRPMTKRIELDEMGSFVWRRIDGEHTVREIAEAFTGAYQVQRREAELSVTAFIRTIGRRGIIGLQ